MQMKIHLFEIIGIKKVGNSGGRKKVQKHCQDSEELEKVLRGVVHSNGLNSNHLACVQVVHGRGNFNLVECQSCVMWAKSYLGVLELEGPEDVIVLVV